MNKVRHVMSIIVITIMVLTAANMVSAQTPTEVPPIFPTEILTVTNAAGYRTQVMPDIGTVEYPLAFYSVWNQCACGTSRANEIWFPGVITLQPNDSVIYGNQFDTVYRVQIAMSEAPGELDSAMFGNGPLMQYAPDLFDPGDVLRLSLNGVPAMRVDNLPVGPSGELTMHIIAVVDGRMIEILVEPVAEVGGSTVDGLQMVEQIIGSIVLESFQ